MPTKLSQFTNDAGYLTSADVDTGQNHTHANKSILDSISQPVVDKWNTVSDKVDKETGKGLSSNDFTTALLGKLNGIAAEANKYTHPSSGVTAGTYKSVTVNAQGHVTGGTNPAWRATAFPMPLPNPIPTIMPVPTRRAVPLPVQPGFPPTGQSPSQGM